MKIGKKGKAWAKTRAVLKKEFENQGITFCERCGSTFGLTMAHRLKRRFIKDEKELRCVAILCLKCHIEAEQMTHENMYRVITEIIEAREVIC